MLHLLRASRIPRSSRRPGLLLLLVPALAWLAGGCAGPERSRQRDDAPPPPPAPYTRVAQPATNTVALQIAIRKFTPARGRGPTIWLTGVSHVGHSNYFGALQRHLDAQSVVLFEGVGASDRSIRFDPEEGASVQHTLAKSLGLVFQLTAIDYDRPHFRNSDLTVPELQRLLAGETSPDRDGGAAGKSSREFDELVGVMNGSSMLGMLVHLGIQFLGSSPKLQAMAKLALIEVLGQFQGDLAEVKGIPPEIKRLMMVLIRSRNDVVFGDLKKLLATGSSPAQSISIFYGAGHMTDLERRLTIELRYRFRDEAWLTALSVDTEAAGLTAAELETVRGLVRWQLEALR